MRLRNIQFSSPETDRKILAWFSLPLMLLFWVFLTLMLALNVHRMFRYGVNDSGQIGWTVFIAVLVVVLIPIQVVRYIRSCRGRR
jgi:hypothetical protein